jgi:1,4-dihydroxy-2-naphthoate octaprenyltransferase
VVPVALGAAAAVGEAGATWWRVAPALLVSLSLQVGVNYANDYSDGVRGTDAVRVGPIRLVGSGLASPGAVKKAALTAFGVAAVAGLGLAAVTSWWLLAVGAAALLAGWGYTGGPKPYGYLGLGEVFVFTFFGLVATAGTTFVLCEHINAVAWLAGCAAGCLACALLVVNNLRDIPTDRDVGKRTLAVRLGDARTRWLYVGLLAVAWVLLIVIAAVDRPLALLGLAGVAVALPAVKAIRSGAKGGALIPVLGATGKVQLITGLLAAAGIAISG